MTVFVIPHECLVREKRTNLFGKVFISHMDVSKVQSYMKKYPFKPYGSKSIADKEVYVKELENVKENGISVSMNDPIGGL